jgi:alginate O-acetyltransferase complex protein AlgI
MPHGGGRPWVLARGRARDEVLQTQVLIVMYWLGVLTLLPLYFSLPARGQNLCMLAASLGFCLALDWRNAVFIAATTALDFAMTRWLAWERPDYVRRRALYCSIGLNLMTLVSFKFGRLWVIESHPSDSTLAEALRSFAPLGISFYTLARLSHTFDVYSRRMRPARSLLECLLLVSFFPLLTAGPIERARNFLPQLTQRREFECQRCYEGAWLIAFGLFKKIFLADHMAVIARRLLDSHPQQSALATVLGLYAYALQIYGDFSGYSAMARGTARLFGIEVTSNFETPYNSVNLAEYWRRWHVSLSSFLQDYVHLPLAMALRDYGEVGLIAALWITFLISGLWHGAAWTFIVWGAVHAVGLSVFSLSFRLRKRLRARLPPRWVAAFGRLVTFHYVCLAYIFFRAPALPAAWKTLASLGAGMRVTPAVSSVWGPLLFYAGMSLATDHVQRGPGREFWIFEQKPWLRTVSYAALLLCIMRLFAPNEAFIYAEF